MVSATPLVARSSQPRAIGTSYLHGGWTSNIRRHDADQPPTCSFSTEFPLKSTYKVCLDGGFFGPLPFSFHLIRSRLRGSGFSLGEALGAGMKKKRRCILIDLRMTVCQYLQTPWTKRRSDMGSWTSIISSSSTVLITNSTAEGIVEREFRRVRMKEWW